MRLQKVLAQAGVASRRASEQMIADGRVSVDGTVVRSQGVRVDPATQVIHVDGERLILDETKHIVLAVNKPIGTVSTMSDPEGRPSIADLIADYPERLYHVVASTSIRPVCCCSPTTASWRTASPTPSMRSARPTWRACTAT